jgi:hypothetical protein
MIPGGFSDAPRATHPATACRLQFANHMGEVLTWRDCKFNGPNNLLITWRLGDPPWNIQPMRESGVFSRCTFH